jgi:hypothetical protein
MKLIRFGIVIILITSFSFTSYAAIEISTDHRSLFFGLMQLGEEKELTQFSTYHNQITCSSTNGNAWYLKINLLKPLTSGEESIPLENFKWQLVWTNGKGTVVNPYQFRGFNLVPDLVYISGADEATGSSINFQFKYYLKIPEVQTSGVYNTTIRFTLTEIL